MTTPDHVENTGDNLRHAAEGTGQQPELNPELAPEDPRFAPPPLEEPDA